MLVDSHCHLDFKELNNESGLGDVLKRASDAGVGLLQTICTKIEEFEKILAIAEQYPQVYCSVGSHPLYVDQLIPAQAIIEKCNHPKVIGIGETGLDYYKSDKKKLQQQNFQEHIRASQATGLPLIVHTRNAEEDTVQMLKDASRNGITGVIHCFTASNWLAQECLDLGMYISASGIVTFKNAKEIQDVFANIPIDKILVETDSPFLAPVPYRGQSNEPSYIKEVVQFLANLRGITYHDMASATTQNFFKLFKKVPQVLL